MLRLRMAEAGADLFYGHEDVAERDALAAVVLAACDDDTTLLTDTGRKRPNPDAALAWIRDHEMDAAFSGEPQKLIPFSRRTVIRIRREVSTRAGLATNYKLPPWRQVVAFVNRARGAELRRPDEADRARPD